MLDIRQVSCLYCEPQVTTGYLSFPTHKARRTPISYLTIARYEGDPDQLVEGYRRSAGLMDQVGRDHGLILHGGARTGEGLLIVNLWPSRSESEAAAQDPRRLEALGRSGPPIRGYHTEHTHLEHCMIPSLAA